MTDDDTDNALCVYIENKDSKLSFDETALKQHVDTILLSLNLTHCELSLSFISSDEIKTINQQYRNKNKPTDVLSFPQEHFRSLPQASKDHLNKQHTLLSKYSLNHIPLILGDVIICGEVAKEQAEQIGHTFDQEIYFLCIHGILHLCGYDHEQEKDEILMLEQQRLIVQLLREQSSQLQKSNFTFNITAKEKG